jgi:hypothetical protein
MIGGLDGMEGVVEYPEEFTKYNRHDGQYVPQEGSLPCSTTYPLMKIIKIKVFSYGIPFASSICAA